MTAYTTDLSAIHDPATNSAPPATFGDALVDNFKSIGESWPAYTPTWSSSGTQPVVNNGILAGAGRTNGKAVNFRIDLTMGSTTTYGTGTYKLTVPTASIASRLQTVPVYMVDSSTSFFYSFTGVIEAGASTIYVPTSNGTTNLWGATLPFTFAQSDRVIICGTYEAA